MLTVLAPHQLDSWLDYRRKLFAAAVWSFTLRSGALVGSDVCAMTILSGSFARSLALSAAGMLAGAAAPAFAADDLLSLCAMSGSGQPVSASASMLADAVSAERQFVESADPVKAADQVIAQLGSRTRGEADVDANALARYCAAAGEAFRLGKTGSAYQARAILLGAFRNAEGLSDRGTSALVAYRLGLVTVGSGGGGVRSARARAEAAQVPASIVSRDAGPCSQLGDPGIVGRSSAVMTVTALRCSIERAGASQNFEIGAKANLRLARFWLEYGRRNPDDFEKSRGQARKVALAALEPTGRIADTDLRVNLLSRLADVALDARGIDSLALSGIPDALEGSAAGQPSRIALAEGLRGRLALASGDKSGAAARFRSAIFHETQSDAPLRLPDWHLLLAEAEPDRKDMHIMAAFRALGATRPLMQRFDSVTEESNFSVRIRPVFEAVVDVLLAQDVTSDDDSRIAGVQAIVEQYRQAELQSVFGSDCVPARVAIDPRDLRDNEVILYPILLSDRVELLYASGKGDRRYKRLAVNRSVDRADVVRLVGQMIGSTSVAEDDEWRDPAKQLYQILIAPLEKELVSGSTLVIVPDGPLAGLPFSTLLDANGQSLVNRTKISVVPSLAYAQPGDLRKPGDIRVVAAALEKEVLLAGGVFPKLEGTADEARAVVAGSRGSRMIENFHRADLVQALNAQRVDVLHLATHASFNGRSDRSFIVADGEAIPIAELRLLIGQNLLRGENLDLLVLSACETAVGDDEASMGLAGAAVQSGANSALASLWEVSDLGTSELMKAFYQRYRAGETKADALRNAQLAMIAKGGEFADPSVWAAFTLLGSWR
jgi:CHAT domain-containing protein